MKEFENVLNDLPGHGKTCPPKKFIGGGSDYKPGEPFRTCF